MISILFVDDDPLMLAGLKQLFRRYGDEWKTEYVTSGHAALARLEQAPFDAIVSDLRMPGLDGGELLQRVRDLYPTMIRVVLSGQTSKESFLRMMGLAHQYLSKPCDPHVLRDTLQRSLALQKRLADPRIQSFVSRLSALPCMPKVFQDIMPELKSPTTSTDRVGQIISRDVALTAKLMQLVNSSYFGLAQKVANPSHAAALLGLNMLKSLVLCAGVLNQFRQSHLTGFSLEQVSQHSVEVGRLANQLAQDIVGDELIADDALLAGLLHDIGQLTLATCPEVPYEAVLRAAQDQNTSIWRAEQAVLGLNHAEVGGYLLGSWGMPQTVVEAVALHHEPSTSGSTRFTALTAVHLANGILNQRYRASQGSPSGCIDTDYLASLDVQSGVSQWIPDAAPRAESLTERA